MKNIYALELLESHFASGTFSTSEALKIGVNKQMIKTLLSLGKIKKIRRSIYIFSGVWEDKEYIFQKNYTKGIISFDSALYILGYIKESPNKIFVTFEKGYNCSSIDLKTTSITRVDKKYYDIGKIIVTSYSGNEIVIYNIERTICDLLRKNDYDRQLVSMVIRRYLQSKKQDMDLLLEYSEKLKVKNKLQVYLDILG